MDSFWRGLQFGLGALFIDPEIFSILY